MLLVEGLPVGGWLVEAWPMEALLVEGLPVGGWLVEGWPIDSLLIEGLAGRGLGDGGLCW